MKLKFTILLLLLMPFGLLAQHTSAKMPFQNVLRLSPISIFYGGVGAGLSYEHFLDKERKISLMLPLSYGLRNYMIGSGSTFGENDKLNYSLLFNPGIRMYPKGQRRLSYAIGASFFTTYGSENGFKQDYKGYNNLAASSSYSVYSNSTEMRLGSIISNSLTVNISKRFNIGAEVLLGCSFKTFIRDKASGTKVTESVKAMGGASLQLGYRF